MPPSRPVGEAAECSLLPVALLDGRGRIVAVNTSWAAELRTEVGPPGPAGGPGDDFLDLCERGRFGPGVADDRFASGVRAVLDGSAPEFRFESPSGAGDDPGRVEWQAVPLAGRTGATVTRAAATARRESEGPRSAAARPSASAGAEALRVSEARYRVLLDSIPVPLFVYDAETLRFLHVNDAMVAEYEYTRAELLGMTVVDVQPPEDVPALSAKLARSGAGYERYGVWRHLKKSGAVIEVEITAHRLDLAGTPACLALAHNVTDRRRAEAALLLRDRAVQAATQGIVIASASEDDCPIVYVSPAFEHMTGYRGDEIVGRNCRFLQGPETDPAVVDRVREAVRTGRPCVVELLNYRKDGSTFWNELSISPVRDADGQLTQFVGVQADVTARRSLEEQFRQVQKMEAVGQLAGGVAHDFNNLLTIINGYSDLLLLDLPEGDPSRALVGEIFKAGERSAALTRQLLAFSRRQVLKPRVLDLNGVVGEAETMLRRLIRENVRLTTDLAPGVWPVQADPGQLEQVLMNLAVNARDAMPTGGTLTIGTRNVDLGPDFGPARPDFSPGPYVRLRVSDTGTGIAPDVLPKIFEPFFTTKGVGVGTGLGLATVFGIVRQSRGYVEVVSAVGAGAAFDVFLPRCEAAGRPADPGAGGGPAPRGRETVLLVEDEHGVRALTRHILAGCGYTVLEASDGAEALRLARDRGATVDVLVTDLVMPGLGGRELADRLRATFPDLEVLYVSGYPDDPAVRHGGLEEGVNFLHKPFSPLALAHKVRDLLDRRGRRT